MHMLKLLGDLDGVMRCSASLAWLLRLFAGLSPPPSRRAIGRVQQLRHGASERCGKWIGLYCRRALHLSVHVLGRICPSRHTPKLFFCIKRVV